jgi:hypothetical protein
MRFNNLSERGRALRLAIGTLLIAGLLLVGTSVAQNGSVAYGPFTCLGDTILPYTSSGGITNGGDYLPLTIASIPTAGGSISGYKINDANGNGIWDQGETGLANWEIGLIDNQRIIINMTDNNGNYFFGGLAAGTYIVEEFAPVCSPWTQTFPTGTYTYTVVLAADQHVTGNNFLNHISEIPVPEFPRLGMIIPVACIFSLVFVLVRRRE